MQHCIDVGGSAQASRYTTHALIALLACLQSTVNIEDGIQAAIQSLEQSETTVTEDSSQSTTAPCTTEKKKTSGGGTQKKSKSNEKKAVTTTAQTHCHSNLIEVLNLGELAQKSMQQTYACCAQFCNELFQVLS